MCLCAFFRSSVPFPRAFTLVELMVVLAVMGVLIAILLPTLQNDRARARSISCQNNLRQYGIAMGRYMSDWKGYFIYSGAGGQSARSGGLGSTTWKTLEDGNIDAGKYDHVYAGAGGVAGSYGQDYSYSTFIASYLPAIKSNLASSISSVSSVKMCPSVQHELRSGNYFDPGTPNNPNPYFKGYRTVEVDSEKCDTADFEDLSGDGYDANNNLILASYFTTYAINNYSGVYQKDRTNISANTIAFIDWNAKEGWGATLCPTNINNQWRFNAKDIVQDVTKKWTTNWCLTEVGFHHKDGTNAYANYVAMDGHVGSVSSNQISLSYFQATGPK